MSATILVHPTAIERIPLRRIVDWADTYGMCLSSVRTRSGKNLLALEKFNVSEVVTPITRAPAHRAQPDAGPDEGPAAA